MTSTLRVFAVVVIGLIFSSSAVVGQRGLDAWYPAGELVVIFKYGPDDPAHTRATRLASPPPSGTKSRSSGPLLGGR